MSNWTRIFFSLKLVKIKSGVVIWFTFQDIFSGLICSCMVRKKKMEFLWQYWNKLKKLLSYAHKS